MENTYLAIVLGPLIAAVIAGLFGRQIGRVGTHTITILAVAVSCALSYEFQKAHQKEIFLVVLLDPISSVEV